MTEDRLTPEYAATLIPSRCFSSDPDHQEQAERECETCAWNADCAASSTRAKRAVRLKDIIEKWSPKERAGFYRGAALQILLAEPDADRLSEAVDHIERLISCLQEIKAA